MSAIGSTTLLRVTHRLNIVMARGAHREEPIPLSDAKWRTKQQLALNQNTCGPLTDYADYSFKDNRPTPYGVNQLRRLYKQQEYAKRIVKLVGEIDYAVERHARLQQEEKDKRERILAGKLKPKGNLPYKTVNNTKETNTKRVE